MRIFCSICKDIFIPYSEIKVTSCGHIYHGSCITRWYTAHKTCPQCRSNIKSQPVRVYFDVEKGGETDASTLEHKLETLTDKLREEENSNKLLKEENEKYERLLKELKECAQSFKDKNDILRISLKTLKDEMAKLSKKNESLSKLQQEVETWKTKANSLENVDNILKGSADEIKTLVRNTPVTSLSVRQLCTYVGVLKVQLSKSQVKTTKLTNENKSLLRKLAEEKFKNVYELEETIKNLRISNSTLEKDLHTVRNLLKEETKKNAANKTVVPEEKVKKQAEGRRLIFDMDIDILDDEPVEKRPIYLDEVPQSIKKWEELVSAGHSRNFGIGYNKYKSFNNTLNKTKDDEEIKRLSTNYAFDGLGGRKKIRLGSPTPREEFLKIKRPTKKKSTVLPQTKKIVDYYQIF